jgi:hypothetical protein
MADARDRLIPAGEAFAAPLLDAPLSKSLLARIDEQRRISAEYLAEALTA